MKRAHLHVLLVGILVLDRLGLQLLRELLDLLLELGRVLLRSGRSGGK